MDIDAAALCVALAAGEGHLAAVGVDNSAGDGGLHIDIDSSAGRFAVCGSGSAGGCYFAVGDGEVIGVDAVALCVAPGVVCGSGSAGGCYFAAGDGDVIGVDAVAACIALADGCGSRSAVSVDGAAGDGDVMGKDAEALCVALAAGCGSSSALRRDAAAGDGDVARGEDPVAVCVIR